MILLIFRTFINRPSTSWIDDYFDWADMSGCCKYFPSNNSFCPHSDPNDMCDNCIINKNYWNRPDTRSFSKFLPYFLQDNPDKDCSKAGHAAYSDVNLNTIYISYTKNTHSFMYCTFRPFFLTTIQLVLAIL